MDSWARIGPPSPSHRISLLRFVRWHELGLLALLFDIPVS